MVEQRNEVIWLIWKSDDGDVIKIGELLKKHSKYYFKYDIEGVKRAEALGFKVLSSFPRIDAEYFREELFLTFSERIASRSKKEIDNLLKQHSMDKYDEFEFLKITGGRCSEDKLEFVEPFVSESVQ